MQPPPTARFVPAVLILAALMPLASCAGAPASTGPWGPSDGATSDGAAGYRLTGWAPSKRFVLRIHPSAAAPTADVVAAAEEVSHRSGIEITLGPAATSTDPDLIGATPEITVVVGAYCPAPAVGCAEMWGQFGFTWADSHVIRDVRVSLVPEVVGDDDLLRPILLHELGHAVGLDHQEEPFLGRRQVMSPLIDPTMAQYREGDLAGLAAVGSMAREAPAWLVALTGGSTLPAPIAVIG